MPGDKGFRYCYSKAHIATVIQKIRDTGRPNKLDFAYIRDTWLLRNAQYGSVIPILEDLGLIDSNGSPTGLYGEIQNQTVSKKSLAKAIKKAYPELFAAYPNASTLPRNDLAGYFKQHTGRAQTALDMTVATFTALCVEADFSNSGEEARPVSQPTQTTAQPTQSGVANLATTEPNIHIDLQIHIAPDMPDEKIEAIFKHMRKYLLPHE